MDTKFFVVSSPRATDLKFVQAGPELAPHAVLTSENHQLVLICTVCVCVCVLSCSVVSNFLQSHGVTCRAPLSMEFSRQEYWSGLPFPTPGDCPNPGIKPMSLVLPALAGRFFTSSSTLEPCFILGMMKMFQVQTVGIVVQY